MNALASALLVLCLGALAWLVRHDVGDYAAFKLLTETADRQRRYRVWIAKSFFLFFGLTLLALAILGRLRAFLVLPPEFAPLSRSLRSLVPRNGLHAEFLIGFGSALFAGMLIGGVVAGIAVKRKRATSKAVLIGDIEALMPRNGPETAYAALLSLNAGLSEELFFRLLLPLLFTIAFRNAVVAFVAATLVFGIIHIYQGWVGVVATIILGLVLAGVYLWTGSILAAIVAHSFVDLIGLVVRPTIGRSFAATSVQHPCRSFRRS
jgi:membrane protease YdiL (CAAX protease family)